MLPDYNGEAQDIFAPYDRDPRDTHPANVMAIRSVGYLVALHARPSSQPFETSDLLRKNARSNIAIRVHSPGVGTSEQFRL